MSPTSLDYALTRWAVECRERANFAGGGWAEIGPYLAGWFCRAYDLALVNAATGTYAATFRRGWMEADSAIRLAGRDDGATGCSRICGFCAHRAHLGQGRIACASLDPKAQRWFAVFVPDGRTMNCAAEDCPEFARRAP